MNELENARQIINEVDTEMAKLFEKRMRAAEMVAHYKKENGLPILDSAREDEIISKGAKRIEDSALREYYVNFLKDTMKVSKQYQSRLIEGMKVAYCGTEGAFAHIATKKIFPSAVSVAYHDFPSVYEAVVNGDCDAAVLPVENSYNGEVGQVTDLVFSGSLYINSMLELGVSQAMLGTKDSELADI